VENHSQKADSPIGLHVMWAGPFGHAVAQYLSILHPCVHASALREPDVSRFENGREPCAEVIASWRPVPRLCVLVAAASQTVKRPFIPLTVDSGLLQLGPVIMPNRSACWDCWTKRARQHSVAPREQAELLRFYDENSEAGPQGFSEPLAMLAAAQIKWAAELCAEDPDRIGGLIWQMHLFSGEVETGHLVGVDGCPVCGLNRPVESRTYSEAKKELAFLWEGTRHGQ
jgi:bacteriocin biosynthesis cyclodehydratase domain-containing protein